jgi:hypothetical protein
MTLKYALLIQRGWIYFFSLDVELMLLFYLQNSQASQIPIYLYVKSIHKELSLFFLLQP